MIRLLFALFVGLLCALGLSAQDTGVDDEEAPEEIPEDPPEDPLKLQRDILQFGITSEVVELLETLETNRDRRLASEVLELLDGDVPVDIQVAAFEYFDAIESPEAVSQGTDVLTLSDELPERLVLSVLRYLGGADAEISLGPDTFEALKSLSGSSDEELSRQALRLMGISESDEALSFLIEVAGSLEEEQPRREAAVLALGDRANGRATEVLTTILTDRVEADTLRWYAADALGKIGDPASVEVLEDQLSDAGTWFRAYLIGALGRYEGQVEDDLFIRSLRDDFWRVRVSALETLGARRSRAALDAIAYRARRDPVADVRTAAFDALGAMQTNEARRFLVDYARETSNTEVHRGTAARVLVERYLTGGRDDIEKLLDQEWSRDRSAVLSSLVMALSNSGDSLAGPLLVKLLDHPDPGTQVRALMGMRRIGAAAYRNELLRLAEESPHGAVRRQAEMALEEM
ncbi:MAG: HEAT repeat domain-containing protein [Spirochaetaceae bacterium]